MIIGLALACMGEIRTAELAPEGWVCVDKDQDGFCIEDDCDDGNFEIYPGALELCDGFDGDCDGEIDEGVELRAYRDADGDGIGAEAQRIEACIIPDGYAPTGGDCDDSNPYAYPGAVEHCEGTDEDCDGEIDEGLEQTFFLDADQDGYGTDEVAIVACWAPEFFIDNGLDCDDSDAAIYPGALEVCDEADNDCDTEIDEHVVPTWYHDADGDGHGDRETALEVCDAPEGYVAEEDDCDDTDPEANPSMPELCNGKDDDCDGSRDEPSAIDAPTWYQDSDRDGFGDSTVSKTLCHDIDGWVEDATDCDDTLAAVNPDSDEVCNGRDDDCDGVVDPDYFSSTFTAPTKLNLNGDALQVWDGSDGFIELTTTNSWEAGSAIFGTAVPGSKWRIQFDAALGEGTGGEGMALVLLNESNPNVVGDPGDSLGAAPLDGWAITLDTQDTEHLGIAECSTLKEQETVPWDLHDEGWITVEVEYDRGNLDIWLDGTLATSTTLSPMPAAILVGWTAGTSTITDVHELDDVTIGCP
ncbi:MAG TPA: MopE-related protein [Myxococcota bacterium]|nr:MopE-related protein [Myxococcota bacterium]